MDYGHGHVSGYGAIGNRGIYGYAHPGAYYGKRDAEAEPEAYTIGQVAHGLPIHNAYATGHPHNVGVVTGVSYGHGLYGAHHGLYYGKREAEAEAKPYYYGGYGLGYAGYGGYGYSGLGYAHHGYYYGKREAEAEAKPYYYGGYGGYGYSRPYSYGTYGLGYGRGYYWG